VNAYFSVGSTIVLLLTALKRTAITKIELAAFEPHVMNIVDILRDAGADIALRYDHTIIVKPVELKKHLTGKVI
jgi:UDP-N-acetylglucosamine enolpyruvyl transferase